MKAKTDLPKVSKPDTNFDSTVLKNLGEVKERLWGIKEGLVSLKESIAKLVLIGKDIIMDVGKVHIVLDNFK